MADQRKVPAGRVSILDRPLIKATKPEVSLSAFALLISEIVQYQQNRVASVVDLGKKYA
jgi:hypothetical protein